MPTLLAPLMMFGAVAVSIPIALHFFYKARHKPLPWAAMTFLKQAVQQTSRRLKFQEWILLAIRCLVLLLLALALARPGAESFAVGGGGDAIDAVFVIDNSFSMGARDGAKTRLEQAKDAAESVLDSLPPRSTVQVYTCADRAALLGPMKRSNLDQARQLIKAIDITSESTDFQPGLSESLTSLAAGSLPSREVYLFSDLQKTGFERQQGAVRGKCEEIRSLASLLFVRSGKPNARPSNVAIMDIKMPTVIPHTGTRVPFDVLVKNTGPAAIRNVRVTLSFRDKPLEREEKTVDVIESGETVPVSLTARLDVAGPRIVTATAAGDEVPGDNEYHRVILVREKVNVLVIDGTPDERNPTESGSHYIRNALVPISEAQQKDYFIQPTIYTAAQASPAVLAGVDVVYLANVPASSDDKPGVAGLSKSFIEAIVAFVRGGGGLVIGCGDLVDAERYNRILGSGGAGLLPFDLGELSSAVPPAAFNPAPETVEEASFLAPFRVPPFSNVFKEVEITKLFKVNETGQGSTGGRVAARVANGTPLICTRVVGEGEVMMVTTSLDSRWGNFPGRGSDAFVPFTQFTLLHLTGRKVPGGTKTAGDVLSWSPPEAGRGFELIKPDGSRVRLGVAQTAGPGSPLMVTTKDTAKAGIYVIVPEGQPEANGAAFAVNPDLRESQNLDTASDTDLENYLKFKPTVVTAGVGTHSAVNQQRIAREYTEYVLLVLFLLVLFESVWAWFCGKAI